MRIQSVRLVKTSLLLLLTIAIGLTTTDVSVAQNQSFTDFVYDQTVDAAGNCTLEALRSGTCFNCPLPNIPLNPNSREADRQLRSGERDIRECALMRVQLWWQQFFPFQMFNCTLGQDCTPLVVFDLDLRNFFADYFSDDIADYEDQPLQNTAPPSDSQVFDPMHHHDPFSRVTGQDLTGVNQKTLAVLRYIEARVSHNLIVTSAFRSEDHNHNVSGARRSQHLTGAAIDLSTYGLSDAELLHLVQVILSHPDVKGFGFYERAIHFDTRAERVGAGYWGRNFSQTGFDADAARGWINQDIVETVYNWSGR